MFFHFYFAKPAQREAARPSLRSLVSRFLLVLLVLLVLLGLPSSGCSRFTRTKQCRALIAQINPALDDVLTITHAGAGAGGRAGASGGSGGGAAGAGGSAAVSNGYIAAAGRYERLAKQLGPMEFGSEEMAKLVAEYAGLLNNTAENLRSLAAAIESTNNAEAERLNRELDRIGAHERSLVNRMDAWCQP
ncbi:MAG TPA: hypothetical protein VJV79_38540 [Polyangiaceae bacterium]|nr:hypothetical protein [Polyangiaceae bacterium]